jgi:hypothetical protein
MKKLITILIILLVTTCTGYTNNYVRRSVPDHRNYHSNNSTYIIGGLLAGMIIGNNIRTQPVYIQPPTYIIQQPVQGYWRYDTIPHFINQPYYQNGLYYPGYMTQIPVYIWIDQFGNRGPIQYIR